MGFSSISTVNSLHDDFDGPLFTLTIDHRDHRLKISCCSGESAARSPTRFPTPPPTSSDSRIDDTIDHHLRINLQTTSTCLDDSNCVNLRSLAVSIVHILPGKWMEWHGVWLTLVINRHMV